MLDRATLKETLETLEAIDYRKTYRTVDYFKPYSKQLDFLAAGADKRERLLLAGNRLGKTQTGAFEMALHATGDYPGWWQGRRFDHPIVAWVCGETSVAVRDVCQSKLCGLPGVEASFGTGLIPKGAFVEKPSMARGVTDAYDTVQVKHRSGGVSVISFKSYEQGREKFQGAGLDVIWFDEEPPLNIYSEGLTRIGERNGIAFVTFTPLLGPTAVVLRFTDEPSPDRVVVSMTLDDVPPDGHITPQQKKTMEAGYLPHERDARARGIPMLGSGRIFMTPEDAIVEAQIQNIPPFWPKLWGIDFGIGHPFAAVLGLWDRDADCIHIHATVRMAGAISLAHAAAMKQIAAAVPVAWPKDGTDRDMHSGEPLAAGYKKHGLLMLHEHANWPDGGMSTEAGLAEWDEREKTGRLKVASHLSDWLEERRFYHRKEGKIVKMKDDLMSATRMILMMKRFARTVQIGGKIAPRNNGQPMMTQGMDFDLFTGA
jgi:phage terminase large subunit-like protein